MEIKQLGFYTCENSEELLITSIHNTIAIGYFEDGTRGKWDSQTGVFISYLQPESAELKSQLSIKDFIKEFEIPWR